jgi:hypothetical protein
VILHVSPHARGVRRKVSAELRREPSHRSFSGLQEDLERQVWRATALEQLDRGMQVNVVTHRKSACRARLVPCPLELFRTPPLDALGLRLIDQGDVYCRHAVPFSPIALIVRSDV